MSYQITTAVRKLAKLRKRIKAVQGGTSAGKTIGILEVLIDRCQRDKKGDVTSVVSETFPHLKRGAIRDFLSIMETQNYFRPERWNKTDYTYIFETGALLEFFSADQPAKSRGPRRKRLFINEANRIPKETFDQLEIRTTDEIWLDWNPSEEFWFYTDLLPTRDDIDHIILTYKDNEALDREIVKAIEQRKSNIAWFKVYGLGQLGEVEGLIYKNWQQIDAVPEEAKLLRRWLDYGYSNDPTAIGDIYKWNDSYVLDEQLYQKGLLNSQIAEFLLNLDQQCAVAADSAEPKSNDELKMRGITVIPARKGKDSILSGIQLVQQEKIFVTKRSHNIWKERMNYIWMVDEKTGKTINEPIPIWNHHMDGIRYGFETLLNAIPDKIRQEQRNMFERNVNRQIMNSMR